MWWPFRRRKLDAFGRPIEQPAARPAPDPGRARDLMPEEVPPPVPRGMTGLKLRPPEPQEFDPDAVEWTQSANGTSGGPV